MDFHSLKQVGTTLPVTDVVPQADPSAFCPSQQLSPWGYHWNVHPLPLHPSLPGTSLVLALNVPCPGMPLSSGQTGTTSHPALEILTADWPLHVRENIGI